MQEVTRTPAGPYRAERALVEVHLPSGRNASVDVFGPEIRFGELQPAQVNWSALGPTGPEDAAAYANAILTATGLAGSLQPATEA